MAEILKTGEAMERALALLEAGEIVAIPTETVYGLAGDATNGEAVARIFEAKGRPRFNPLIAHVSGMAMAKRIADFDPLSRKARRRLLARSADAGAAACQAFAASIRWSPPASTRSRCACRRGSAPNSSRASAGRSQHPAPIRRAASPRPRLKRWTADLGGKIPLIVDGGPTDVGLESTIVKVEGETVRLLRPGGIAAEVIEAAVGRPLLRGAAAGIEAPGMLASHYAPGAAVRVGRNEACGRARRCSPSAHAARRAPRCAVAMLNLSPSGDLREAAANLFSILQAPRRAAALQPSPSSRSRTPASARRSTTGSRAPPRRATLPSDSAMTGAIDPALLDRFAAIVGEAHAVRTEADIVALRARAARPLSGPVAAGAEARQRRRGQPHPEARHRDQHADRAAGRQHRSRRRPGAARFRQRDRRCRCRG